MEEQTIPFAECSQYLYRLHKEELFDIAHYLNIDTYVRMSKTDIVAAIKEIHPQGFTLNELAELDISYTHNQMKKVKWSVFQLSGPTSKNPKSVNPKMINRMIMDELLTLVNCHVYSVVQEGILWVRIVIAEPILGEVEYIPSSTNETSITYIAHLMGSNYFLVSPLPEDYTSIITTSFCLGVKQAKCTSLELSGYHIQSLLDLVMNTRAAGYADYLNQLKEKRPLEHGSIPDTIPVVLHHLPPHVHVIDETSIRQHHIRGETEWGIADPPALQQVIVNSKMDAIMEGSVITDVHMEVEFEGPNVLKGLKQLSQCGYMTNIPVKLLNISRNPKNIIDLTALSENEEEEAI